MTVEKRKPKFTPRMMEDDTAKLCERSDKLIRESKVTVKKTKRLIEESRKLIGKRAS